ncbi:MAG: hypothetical protein DSY82_04965 [Flavobacteriia bacterium]|nr:MAG: hypothetical protein DSY82_04965 [Flavobacteriia bacterium]
MKFFFSFVFIIQVGHKKIIYPQWMLFFFPLLTFLLSGFIDKLLNGNLQVIIMGGYLNLILVVFFTASTLALWNYKPKQ